MRRRSRESLFRFEGLLVRLAVRVGCDPEALADLDLGRRRPRIAPTGAGLARREPRRLPVRSRSPAIGASATRLRRARHRRRLAAPSTRRRSSSRPSARDQACRRTTAARDRRGLRSGSAPDPDDDGFHRRHYTARAALGELLLRPWLPPRRHQPPRATAATCLRDKYTAKPLADPAPMQTAPAFSAFFVRIAGQGAPLERAVRRGRATSALRCTRRKWSPRRSSRSASESSSTCVCSRGAQGHVLELGLQVEHVAPPAHE